MKTKIKNTLKYYYEDNEVIILTGSLIIGIQIISYAVTKLIPSLI